MEVSGRTGSSDPVISCQPCQGDGDTVQAEGFCENCNEFICSSCIKAHEKLAGTKNHVIKSKDEMPKSPAAQSDPCTELCEVHKNEIVKFYCQQHDSVGCGDCMVLEHTSCKVQLVSDVSCNYDKSDELVLIKHRIDLLKKNLNSCKREIKYSLKTVAEIKTSIINEIGQFRKKMDAYLDKVTKDLIHQVEKLSASDVSRQQILQSKCQATAEEIGKHQTKLAQCIDNINDLFVSSKRVNNKLQKCKEINEEISAKSQIYTIKFSPAEDLCALKVQNACLGILETQVKTFSGECEKSIIDMSAHFIKKILLRGKQESECGIGGMTKLSEAEILCADSLNMSVKVLNHKMGTITSTLNVSCRPADVTTIDSTTAATTLYEEGKILVLSVRNGLTISHSIKVRENCGGIDYHNGIMAVTFLDPPAVQVIDIEGHILHEVNVTSILKEPYRVCISNDNESMFVSDLENNAVYEFTVQGDLKNTIKSDQMKTPLGITVTSCGNVVVCDPKKSDNVGVIVPGAREILPLSVQNSKAPFSTLICKEQRKMFICEHCQSQDASYIKMFDLK